MFQFTLNTVYGRYVRHRKQHRSLLRGQRTACRYKPRSRDLIITAWVVSSLQCRSSECHLPLKCTNWRFSHAPAPVANTGVSKIFVTLAHSVWLEQPNSVHLGAELFTREVNMLPFQWTGPQLLPPRAGSGVVRIDPLRFLAECRKRRLNQVPFVLSLNLGLFWCMCCAVN